MKDPGDLSSYELRTSHAAIRSYRYYQQIEPRFSNFLPLFQQLAR